MKFGEVQQAAAASLRWVLEILAGEWFEAGGRLRLAERGDG